MSNVSLTVKQDKSELSKQKVTVNSAAVVASQFLFVMCDCMVDSDVGMGHISYVLGI